MAYASAFSVSGGGNTTADHTWQSSDPLLLPYLQAYQNRDVKAAQTHLEHLIRSYVDPNVAAATRRYATANLESDVRGATILLLLTRLRAVRDATSPPIRDLRAYVYASARNVCWQEACRTTERKPYRLFLKETNGGTFGSAESPTASWQELSSDHSTVGADVFDLNGFTTQRSMLRAAWHEILGLPDAQRRALLLSFRDGSGSSGIALLVACGVASQTAVAHALGISETMLDGLLELLPLDDKTIAQRIAPSPSTLPSMQSVINLRLSARRRLQRRLSAWLAV